MQQMSLFQPEKPPAWTVTDLTGYVRDLIESDYNLQDVWVMGEVSNISNPRSGHLYFTLKDSKSALKCVMWRTQVSRLRFLPRDGDAVEVHGKLGVYETSGQYQLYADAIRLAGEGVLYQEFLRLKAQLEAEGLFDQERKRPLPAWPQRIGIITSPTGAALQDMLNTLRRRFPLAQVSIMPTLVQGDAAPPQIVKALKIMNTRVQPDVILLARGGGSMEDLWAFNDEQVVRAVAGSAVPVITGVGHETDFTLVDFASDVRAPTPTAAAELVTPDQMEIRQGLRDVVGVLAGSVMQWVEAHRWELNDLQRQLHAHSPKSRIQTDRQRVDELLHDLDRAISYRLELDRTRLEGLTHRLRALNPLGVLQRGFAVVTKPDGTVVRSVHQVATGESLDVKVSDGTFKVKKQ